MFPSFLGKRFDGPRFTHSSVMRNKRGVLESGRGQVRLSVCAQIRKRMVVEIMKVLTRFLRHFGSSSCVGNLVAIPAVSILPEDLLVLSRPAEDALKKVCSE